MAGRLRRVVGVVGGAVRRIRWLAGGLVGSALGGVGLVLGAVVLWFAVTAPVTGCVTGGGGDCPGDALTVVDGLARWLGAAVLLYAGGSMLVRAWR
jgi:hypothetical protein